ncbi:hypothetical protein TWF730_009058 [Orbilia blumenaviensis]|uniref:F-box domain-containing protein n=1 Tax=Orbilia blumenaviensis TaxID=1796055 RepID=A0AAV9V175_9PEZI
MSSSTLPFPIHTQVPDVDEDPRIHQSQLLALPFDVFHIICGYLDLRSRIALSLTTKRLQYLKPKKEKQSSRRLHCLSIIYGQLIPPRTINSIYIFADGFVSVPRGYADLVTASRGKQKCQFCFETLCSPLCDSALFLDIATGILYPPSLYPVGTAKLLVYPETTTRNYDFASSWRDPRHETRPFGVGNTYSTIWCSHHRCPWDMFAKQKPVKPAKPAKPATTSQKVKKPENIFEKLKPSFSEPQSLLGPVQFLPTEKLRFEQAFRDGLSFHRMQHQISTKWIGGRFLVGHRNIPGWVLRKKDG